MNSLQAIKACLRNYGEIYRFSTAVSRFSKEHQNNLTFAATNRNRLFSLWNNIELTLYKAGLMEDVAAVRRFVERIPKEVTPLETKGRVLRLDKAFMTYQRGLQNLSEGEQKAEQDKELFREAVLNNLVPQSNKLSLIATHRLTIDRLKEHVKELEERRLTPVLLDKRGNPFYLSTSSIRSAGRGLYKAGLLNRVELLEYFLRLIPEAYTDEESPTGSFNLTEALNRFESAHRGLETDGSLDTDNKLKLELLRVKQAIKIELPLVEKYKRRSEQIMQFLHDLRQCKDLAEAGDLIVKTALKLWPGGAPTLMLLVIVEEEVHIKPIAVAMAPLEKFIGQHLIFKKEVGKYTFPVVAFTEDQFLTGQSATKLCQALKKYCDEVSFLAEENTVAWLNESLRKLDSAKLLKSIGQKGQEIKKDLLEVLRKTEGFRDKDFVNLSPAEQLQIKRLSRLLIEDLLPDLCPVSPERKNPHVKAAFNEGLEIERGVDPKRYGVWCRGFADVDSLTGMAKMMFEAMHWAGGDIATIPLTEENPETNKVEIKAYLAIGKKGSFGPQDEEDIRHFADGAAEALNIIFRRETEKRLNENLKDAVTKLEQALEQAEKTKREAEQNAQRAIEFAEERDRYATRIFEMQLALIEKERLAAIGDTARSLLHFLRNVTNSGLGNNEELGKLVQEIETHLIMIDQKLALGLSVVANLELLRELQQKQAQSLAANGKLWDRVSGLATNINALSREGQTKRSIISVKKVIRGFILNELAEAIKNAERRGIKFSVAEFSLRDLSDDDGILVNEMELLDLLLNLINNAVDAFDNLPQEKNKQIVFSIKRNNEEDSRDSIVFMVKDTGCGIPEHIKRILGKKVKTTKGDQGTGIGMVTVYKIVERNEGEISVISEEGEGTTIKIKFERKICEKNIEDKKETKNKRPINLLAAKGKALWVIDDEEANRRLIARNAQQAGMDVREFKNAQEAATAMAEALAEVPNLPESEVKLPDMIITDYHMPEMTGIELLAVVDTSYHQARIEKRPICIICTGLANIGNKKGHQVMEKLNVSLIQKPFCNIAETLAGYFDNGEAPLNDNANQSASPVFNQENPFYDFAELLGHKINSSQTSLRSFATYYKINSERAVANIKKFKAIFDELKLFVETAKSTSFENEAIGLLPKAIAEAPSMRDIWERIEPDQRNNLAVLCNFVLDQIAKELEDLDLLLMQNLWGPNKIKRLMDISDTMTILTSALQLSEQGKRVMENFSEEHALKHQALSLKFYSLYELMGSLNEQAVNKSLQGILALFVKGVDHDFRNKSSVPLTFLDLLKEDGFYLNDKEEVEKLLRQVISVLECFREFSQGRGLEEIFKARLTTPGAATAEQQKLWGDLEQQQKEQLFQKARDLSVFIFEQSGGVAPLDHFIKEMKELFPLIEVMGDNDQENNIKEMLKERRQIITEMESYLNGFLEQADKVLKKPQPYAKIT